MGQTKKNSYFCSFDANVLISMNQGQMSICALGEDKRANCRPSGDLSEHACYPKTFLKKRPGIKQTEEGLMRFKS